MSNFDDNIIIFEARRALVKAYKHLTGRRGLCYNNKLYHSELLAKVVNY